MQSMQHCKPNGRCESCMADCEALQRHRTLWPNGHRKPGFELPMRQGVPLRREAPALRSCIPGEPGRNCDQGPVDRVPKERNDRPQPALTWSDGNRNKDSVANPGAGVAAIGVMLSLSQTETHGDQRSQNPSEATPWGVQLPSRHHIRSSLLPSF